MIAEIENACEEIDAAMFTGDTFHSEPALNELEFYVGRWRREMERIKIMIEEEQK